MLPNRFLTHLHHLQLNPLQYRNNRNWDSNLSKSGTSRPPEGIDEDLYFNDFRFP